MLLVFLLKVMIRCWSFWILVFGILDNVVEGQQCALGSYLETVGNHFDQVQYGNVVYTTRIILNSVGSYTFSNINKVNILVVGGGGAGGGGRSSSDPMWRYLGGGGGGGNCQETFNITLSSNKVMQWSVASAAISPVLNLPVSGSATSVTVAGTVFSMQGGGGGVGSSTNANANGASGGGGSVYYTNGVNSAGTAITEGVTGYNGCTGTADNNGGGGGGKGGTCSGKTGGNGMISNLILNKSLVVCGGGSGGIFGSSGGATHQVLYGWGGDGSSAVKAAGPTGHSGGNGGPPAIFVNYACTILGEITCPNNTQSRVGATSLSECTPIAGYYGPAGSVPSLCPVNYYCPSNSSSPIQCTQNMVSNAGSSNISDCFYPISVNFSVNTTNLSFSVNDLQNYMAQRNDLGLNFNFTFAQKSNVFVEAQACPAGYVCPVNSTSTIACVKGTYNNQTNAFASSQCATCPVGFYCPVASVNPTRCPDYTTSVEGQDSVLQCTCLAGYFCKYAKRIYGRVTLNISAAAFGASMQSNFRKAIAAAAGVTESDVLILSVNSGTGGGGSRRRLLSLGSSLLQEQGKPASGGFLESFMDVHIQVLNAEVLRDIKKHVDLHCGAGYHVDHEWRENHGVVALPSLPSLP